jgi:hypothetical protein
MNQLSRFQIRCAASALILLFYWPLSHWCYPDLYHRIFGFAPGTYDPDFVKIIGTMGLMPVAGFVHAAIRPAQARGFLVAFTAWCFLQSATYVDVILGGRFPKAEYFNAALIFLVGLSMLSRTSRARTETAGR